MASFIPRQTRSEAFYKLSFNRASIKKLVCTKKGFPGQYAYIRYSIGNAFVWSESLDENAVQTLVDSDRRPFPGELRQVACHKSGHSC